MNNNEKIFIKFVLYFIKRKMVITEKDFLYVEWVPTDPIPEAPASAPVEAPAPAPVEAPAAAPVEEVVATEEVVTENDKNLAEEQVEEIEQLASWVEDVVETPSEPQADDVSWDELQRMLDALWESAEESVWTTQEIKEAAEEVKEAIPVEDKESIAKVDDLLVKIAELETENQKYLKTVDVLKTEYDKILTDKLNLEYWTANDSKVVSMVNEDADIKNVLSAKIIADKTWNSDQLIAAYKSALEGLTGQSFDEVIKLQNDLETNAMASWEDSWTELADASGDNLLL